MVHSPKLHCLSLHQELLQKKSSPQVLLGVDSGNPPPPPRSQAWQSVVLSWRTGQCTPQAGAVTIGVLDLGKVVSVSLADSLSGRLNPQIFSIRCYRLLLFPGHLYMGLRSHAPGGEEFCSQDIPPAF